MSEITTVRGYLEEYLTGREATLKSISSAPHFLPLSTNLLKVSLGHHIDLDEISFEDFAKKIQEFTKSNIKRRPLVLDSNSFYTADGTKVTGENITRYTPACVYERDILRGVLYASTNSYESARTGLFAPFLNKLMTVYLNKDSGLEFNVGHTDITYQRQKLASTVAGAQLESLIPAVGSIQFSGKGSRDKNASINKVFDELSSLREDFEVHKSYGTSIALKLSKNFKEALLSVSANIVLIQEGDENKSWGSGPEAKLIRNIKKVLSTLHFSRNLEEEIALRVRNAIIGENTSDSNSSVDIVAKSKPSNKLPLAKPTTPASSRVRNLKGHFFSLAALQVILNQQLADRIKTNMGTGTATKVLNYRSGRFADAVKVERMSSSREGMITAFYTYMKYPYQTFEPGYKQGSPASRNPRLLISQSIREIAATVVKNRLRAVLI
jgi:hypothetical protein